jgi:hypothetical protein
MGEGERKRGIIMDKELYESDFNELEFKDIIECPYCEAKMSVFDFEDEGIDIFDAEEDSIETVCLFCGEDILIISSVDKKFIAVER